MTHSNPTGFTNPHSIAHRVARLTWNIVWTCFFRTSPRLPHIFDHWRCFLLRCFGAKLARTFVISPSVRVWAPWRLSVGAGGAIDGRVYLYNTYGLEIGDRVIISYETQCVTASHDHSRPDYPLIGERITIGNDVWIAAQAFIAPGVTIGEGCVIAARSVITRDTEPWSIYAGNPAVRKKERVIDSPTG